MTKLPPRRHLIVLGVVTAVGLALVALVAFGNPGSGSTGGPGIALAADKQVTWAPGVTCRETAKGAYCEVAFAELAKQVLLLHDDGVGATCWAWLNSSSGGSRTGPIACTPDSSLAKVSGVR